MFKKLHIQCTQLPESPLVWTRPQKKDRHTRTSAKFLNIVIWPGPSVDNFSFLCFFFSYSCLLQFKNLCLNQYGSNPSSAQDVLDLDLFPYQDKSSHSVISTFDLYSQNQIPLFYLVALDLNKFIIFPPYFWIVKIKTEEIDFGNITAQLMIWSIQTQVYENHQNLH